MDEVYRGQYHNLVSRPFPLISGRGQQSIYFGRYGRDRQSNAAPAIVAVRVAALCIAFVTKVHLLNLEQLNRVLEIVLFFYI